MITGVIMKRDDNTGKMVIYKARSEDWERLESVSCLCFWVYGLKVVGMTYVSRNHPVYDTYSGSATKPIH